MSGRRSHPRFAAASAWSGAVKVLREAVIERIDHDAVLAVCQVPCVVGEEMTLDLLGGGATVAVTVKVLESHPVIVAGSVRHRVRLAVMTAESGPGDSAEDLAEAL